MSFRKNIFVFAILIAAYSKGAAQSYRPSLDIRVPLTPEAIMINGEQIVYYELHLTNFSADTLRLKALLIKRTNDSSVVAEFDGDKLQSRFSQGAGKPGGKQLLAPGMAGVVYLEYNVSKTAQVVHELLLEATGVGKRSTYTIKGERLDMTKRTSLILGPPLNGGPWAAIYDPAWERGHRRVLYTVDGKARIPGRFAIDFIKLNQEGHYARNDEDSISNWLGYNADVLSVSPGTVVAVRNDYHESPTVSANPVPPAENATGNYIALDIGNNHIVFYEHLKPGSIRVNVGQQVSKGQVIAALGFTGQTTGPHLHFHVADRNAPLGAEGVPFVFERFTLLGTYADLSRFGLQRWTPVPGKAERTTERPSPNAVVQFKP
jgi:biotin carboxyl carrier protein